MIQSVTKKQVKEYVASGGVKCLYCRSENIEAGQLSDLDGGMVHQEVCCIECEKTWADVYLLKGVA